MGRLYLDSKRLTIALLIGLNRKLKGEGPNVCHWNKTKTINRLEIIIEFLPWFEPGDQILEPAELGHGGEPRWLKDKTRPAWFWMRDWNWMEPGGSWTSSGWVGSWMLSWTISWISSCSWLFWPSRSIKCWTALLSSSRMTLVPDRVVGPLRTMGTSTWMAASDSLWCISKYMFSPCWALALCLVSFLQPSNLIFELL